VNFTARGLLFLFFFDFEYFPAFKMAAIWTNPVGSAHFTTVAAHNQVGGYQRVMSTPAIAPARSMFSFRLRCHQVTPIKSNWQSLVLELPS